VNEEAQGLEDLNIQIPAGFGLKAGRIIKDKNGYIYETPKGRILIKKVFESYDFISFSHSLKEALYKEGFELTDRYRLSTSGLPYVLWENKAYVAKEYLPFRGIDFNDNDDLRAALTSIARMHRASRGKRLYPAYYGDQGLKDKYSDKLRELQTAKKKAGQKKRLSDFDVMFLKNYTYYEERLQKSIDILSATDENKAEKCFCHNYLKEETILINDEKQAILTDFSRCLIDTPVTDLVQIINRYIKCKPSCPLSITDILNIYQNENPLSEDELRLLRPLLMYPEAFLKLSFRYYSKNRSWIPGSIVKRMESVMNPQELLERYLEEL